VEVLFEAVKAFGLPVALLLFMVWQDVKRKSDDRKERTLLFNRIQALEEYQKNDLAKISITSATAVQNSVDIHREAIETHRELVNSMKQLTLAIRTRPCLEHAVDVIERKGT